MPNDLRFVRDVLSRLEVAGLDVWLAGGWAEELHGLLEPRPHHDVDLLYRGESFDSLDAFLGTGAVTEIAAKRFAHKRAFELDGTMVELILVEPDLLGGDGTPGGLNPVALTGHADRRVRSPWRRRSPTSR